MSKIHIKRTSDEAILVNKKVVYRDMNGNWIAVTQLTPSEYEAFQKYKVGILDKE